MTTLNENQKIENQLALDRSDGRICRMCDAPAPESIAHFKEYEIEGEYFAKRLCHECVKLLEHTGKITPPYLQYACSYCRRNELKRMHLGYGACKSCMKTVKTKDEAEAAVAAASKKYGKPYRWKK